MVSAISNLFPNDPVPTANVSSGPPPTPKVPPAGQTTSDSVQLTESQQVLLLYNQGQPVSQIASTLSLSVADVNNYLSIPGSSG
jgi:DNA-binding NarL/FixJ family response regulator